jgi:hypothetical protein
LTAAEVEKVTRPQPPAAYAMLEKKHITPKKLMTGT